MRTEYKVVYSDSISDLESIVNSLFKEDRRWRVHGGICVLPREDSMGDFYYQAMTREVAE